MKPWLCNYGLVLPIQAILSSMTDDVTLLFFALGQVLTESTHQRVAAAGYDDLRPSHGYVFQHLIPGAKTIGELAERLGITAQGASKVVGELEQMGYVRRSPAPSDQRARVVELTDRAWGAIEATRADRARVNAEIKAALGDADFANLVAMLHRVADQTGALETMFGRRLRPPR